MIAGEIRRIMNRPIIYISILVGVLILNRPLIEAVCTNALGSGSISQVLSVPLAMSDFTPFAAVFCVLPYADSFCDDYNSGSIYNIVSRSGIKKYSLIRGITVFVSGGIVMAIILLVTILFCGLLSDLPDTPETVQFMDKTIWVRSGIIYVMNGNLYLFLRIVLGFLFGGLWSLVGLFISTLICNRYVTYIAPFVIYQFMWFVFDETKWNPVYMLRGDSNFIPSLSFVLLYQFSAILFMYVLSVICVSKKVRI